MLVTIEDTLNKKISSSNLNNILLDLDLDEGIRIEEHKGKKKIFVTRNLLGEYNILVRTNKKVKGKKENSEENSQGNEGKKSGIIEQTFRYSQADLILKFLKDDSRNSDIWLY